ncbi:MAG: NOP5/NOP56 family protein [Nitrososphaeria archaeon]
MKKLKITIFAHEAGISLLNEDLKAIDRIEYLKDPVSEFHRFLSGQEHNLTEKVISKIRPLKAEKIAVQTQALKNTLSKEFSDVEVLPEEELSKIVSEKMKIMLESRFAESEEKVYDILRQFSLRQAEARIAEESTRLDLQAMQAILALDELDKMINILGTRVKEWYEIHFPEILQFYDEPTEICKFVTEIGDRRNLDEEKLNPLKLSESRKQAILQAAQKSRGGIFREEDMARTVMLASFVGETYNIKKKMSSFIENVMAQIAPNVTKICGPTIGARLIAKAGGLEKLAMLPASTIQILGAEKAIFRAIRTGAKPPKHGVIFQHTLIHESPKWQRGRIARALASKIAIAARVDYYRKKLDVSIEEDLMRRIKEIRKSKERVHREEKEERKFKSKRRKR